MNHDSIGSDSASPPEASSAMGRWFIAMESRLGRFRTALIWGLGCQLLSFTFYSYHFWQDPPTRFRHTFAVLCGNPFTHATVDTPQARHRILGPLIAYAVGLRGVAGQAVLVIATTVFLCRLYLVLRSRWDGELSAILTLLLATTPAVVTSQTWPGYPDILASLALLECLASRSPWMMGPLILLGMLGDERCIAAAPLVAVWHLAVGSDSRPIRSLLVRGAMSAAALLVWIGFYRWIQAEYVVNMKSFSNSFFLKQHLSGDISHDGYLNIPGAVYYSLRQAWVLPIAALAYSAIRGRHIDWIFTTFLVGLAMIPGIIVGDHSRCIAMCWPLVLIAAVRVQQVKPRLLTDLVALCVLTNLMTPMYEVFSSGFYLRLPLPAALLRLVV